MRNLLLSLLITALPMVANAQLVVTGTNHIVHGQLWYCGNWENAEYGTIVNEEDCSEKIETEAVGFFDGTYIYSIPPTYFAREANYYGSVSYYGGYLDWYSLNDYEKTFYEVPEGHIVVEDDWETGESFYIKPYEYDDLVIINNSTYPLVIRVDGSLGEGYKFHLPPISIDFEGKIGQIESSNTIEIEQDFYRLDSETGIKIEFSNTSTFIMVITTPNPNLNFLDPDYMHGWSEFTLGISSAYPYSAHLDNNNHEVFGSQYDDRIHLGCGDNNYVEGGYGNDIIYAGHPTQFYRYMDTECSSYDCENNIYGDYGNDTIQNKYCKGTIEGNDGNDTLFGYNTNIYGYSGNDIIQGGLLTIPTSTIEVLGGLDQDTITILDPENISIEHPEKMFINGGWYGGGQFFDVVDCSCFTSECGYGGGDYSNCLGEYCPYDCGNP